MSKSNEHSAGQPAQFKRDRRRALKVLGAGVVSPLAITALDVAAATSGATADVTGTNSGTLDGAAGGYTHDLEIHVFSSSGVVEDSLLIKNNLDERLVVNTFRPGMIIFDDRFIHLPSVIEAAFGNGGPVLNLEAGQTISLTTVSEPLYGRQWARKSNLITNDFVEYLWADDAITNVSDDAILVSTAAFVTDNTALLYSNPKQSIGTGVVIS